jgi:hypothetical protein
MKNPFVIFTAFTKNTNYENIAKTLQQDCRSLQVPFYSLGYDSKDSWVENTMVKPKLILDAWDKLEENFYNLVWIDADARLEGYPKYFKELSDNEIDFSVFQMGAESRVTSGTIFIRLNSKMKEFVSRWNQLCETDKERKGDQHCLRKIIASGIYRQLGVGHKSLPYSYCYIFDDTLRKLAKNIKPLKEKPIIKHMQASRDKRNASQILKNEIG